MTARLLVPGRILTFDAPTRGEAVLVDGGRIEAVADVRSLRRAHPAAELVDLPGALLLPGLHDTHTHFFELARRRASIDLSTARSADDVRNVLQRYRGRRPAALGWIGGGGWDADRLGRVDRALLDEVFPDLPVSLESRDYHTLWCNTAALAAAGVLAGRNAPAGGEIGRRADGTPDGLLYETAWELVWSVRPSEPSAVADAWLRDAVAHAHALGLTGIHCMEVQSTYAHYRRLAERGALGLRVCFHSPLDHLRERIAAHAAREDEDGPWLRLGGVKVFMDGSLGSRSAYMYHEYPQGGRGRLLRTEEELLEIVLTAGRAGIGASVHAIGDATVDIVARCFQTARRELGSGLGLRIEHAQCVQPATVRALASARVDCAVQPVHLLDDIPLLEPLWKDAARHAYPLRSLRDAGVRLGLGSDAPVATLDPRAGLVAACLRGGPRFTPWHREQALTVAEALAGYTVDAAALGGWRELGRVAPGQRADLVAMDDVLDEPPASWLDATVRMTMVDGTIVHHA